jgi:hypothetical protein
MQSQSSKSTQATSKKQNNFAGNRVRQSDLGERLFFIGERFHFGNGKHQGAWVELLFMARIAGLGCTPNTPHGDNSAYDSIVQHRWKLSRVQVKSVGTLRNCCYQVKIEYPYKPHYKSRDVDFVAVYVIPADTWYVIPLGALRGIKIIMLRPNRPTKARRFEKYREAWHLLLAEGRPKTRK